MSHRNVSLRKNLIYQLIYQLVILLSPLVVTPYLSRVLGPTELGRYSYAFSVAYYYVLVANLGIPAHGSRQIAAVKDDEHSLNDSFSNLFWLHALSAVTVTGIYLICVRTVFVSDRRVAYIMALYVGSAIFNVKWLFYGLENFKITVIRSVIIKIASVIAVFAFVRTRDDVAVYSFIVAGIMYFAAELSLFVLFPRYVKLKKPNWKAMKRELSPLLILFIPTAATVICRHIDKVMLGMMSTLDQVGIYENTDKVYLMLVTIITTVGDVIAPRMTNLLAKGDKKEADRLLTYSLNTCIITACAFMFGISAISPEFVPLFFGKEFVECVSLLVVISPTILMLAWSATVRQQYLVPHYRNRIFVISIAVGTIVNIIANIFFIPRYEALGAVYGTLIAEFVIVIMQVLLTFKEIQYGFFLKQTILFCMIGIVMLLAVRGIAALHIPSPLVSLLSEIIVGTIVYMGLTIALLALTKNDLYLLGRRAIYSKFNRKRTRV